jgi:hypothetical protein
MARPRGLFKARPDLELKLRLYVIPRIGHMKVVDVGAEHIRDLSLSAKKKSGRNGVGTPPTPREWGLLEPVR